MNRLFALATEIAAQGFWWVQGAGGNVSFKEEGTLFIKPSGVRLDEMGKSRVAVSFRLEDSASQLKKLAENGDEVGYMSWLKQGTLTSDLRPSMETGFHAVLKGQYVTHFHSLVGVLIAHQYQLDRERVEAWYQKNFSAQLGVMQVVPLLMPGLELADYLCGKSDANLYFLQNHGVILSTLDIPKLSVFRQLEIDFLHTFGYSHGAQTMSYKESHLPSGHSRPYFPDFVIVEEKLKKNLVAILEKWSLAETCTDINLKEIWWAHLELTAMEPDLLPLPETFCKKLKQLPTEIIRKQKMGV